MKKRFLQMLGRAPGPDARDAAAEAEQGGSTRLGRIVDRDSTAPGTPAPGAPQAKVKRIFKS